MLIKLMPLSTLPYISFIDISLRLKLNFISIVGERLVTFFELLELLLLFFDYYYYCYF